MKKILIALLIMSSNYTSAQLNIVQRSHLTYPGKSLANIWGYTDSLNREFALVGTSTGISIVNVTNADSVYEVAAVAGTNSIWREVKTWGKYAYVTTEGCCNGIQIINLSYLPDSAPSKYYKGDGAISNLLGRAHALHIDNGYAYMYGCNMPTGGYLLGGSAIILNLANPWMPVYTGNTMTNGINNYIHDGYVRNDTLWGGHVYGGFFSVFNLQNKAVPVLINTQATPNNFTHNTWLSDNGKTLFTTDEVSNSFLASYDVSDVNNISLLDKIQSTPGNGSIVHNVHIKNDFAVAAYYTEGIAIFDAARPANLAKVGFFDTSPAYSGNGYNGAWGVYPYFPSGNIVVADIEQGLYVLTPSYVRACYLEGIVKDSLTGALLNNVSVQIINTSLVETTDYTGSFKMATITSGNFNVKFLANGYQSKTINVNLTNGALINLTVQLALPVVAVTGNISQLANGMPISTAKVRLESGAAAYETTTDVSGNYSMAGITPGNYTIIAGKWAFQKVCNSVSISSAQSNFSYQLAKGIQDDFSLNLGWKATGNAKKGMWTRGVPVGTTYNVFGDANPAFDDNSDCSNKCFVTGNGGGNYNFDDVDSGYTTLISPVFNLNTYGNPYVNFNRWYFAVPNSNDTLTIKITNGTDTVVLENVTKNSVGNSTWKSKSFRVLNYLSKSNTMKLLFTLKDKNPDHCIEAGLDNFYVTNNIPALAIDNNSSTKITTEFTDELMVYPNPVKGILNIDFKVPQHNLKIRLYDMTGKTIHQSEKQEITDSFQINIENSFVEKGIYLLQIMSDQLSEVRRVVIQ